MLRLPLRLRLPLLVAGTTLPLILFAAGLVYLKHVRDREAAFERVLETVKGIQLVLDSELQGITLALEVLANSRALQNQDFDGFRNNVTAFLRRYPPPSAISLAGRDGTQLFNSNMQPGHPIPRRVYTRSIEEVFRTGRPFYSDIFIGSVSRQRIVAVSVPVIRDGQVTTEIAFNPPLEMFQHIIQRQRPSDDWTMSIFDRTGTNLARVPIRSRPSVCRRRPLCCPRCFRRRKASLPLSRWRASNCSRLSPARPSPAGQ